MGRCSVAPAGVFLFVTLVPFSGSLFVAVTQPVISA